MAGCLGGADCVGTWGRKSTPAFNFQNFTPN